MGMKSSGGEIVQVQGGHIVRSTGRKDRHSKVYTSKGPRDRRVRLSAHTAIQFYDVQDRLGYDRPSKAVDWLIRKAKSSIDNLAELPPWNPTTVVDATTEAQDQEAEQNAGSGEMAIAEQSESSAYNFHLQRQLGENPGNHSAFIPPPSIDTDAIAFFPTTTSASSLNFQSYPPDIISRNNNSTEDLGLSLHSFQDPGLTLINHGQQSQPGANQTPSNDHHQTLFAGSNQVGFDTNYQRIVNWNSEATSDISRGGFMVNSPQFLGQGSASAYSQSGTLHSSFSPSVHQASIFGSRFLSDGLPGFCIPARIQGEEENHGIAASHRLPSASRNSHH